MWQHLFNFDQLISGHSEQRKWQSGGMQWRLQPEGRHGDYLPTRLGVDRGVGRGPRLRPQRQGPPEVTESEDRQIRCHNQ